MYTGRQRPKIDDQRNGLVSAQKASKLPDSHPAMTKISPRFIFDYPSNFSCISSNSTFSGKEEKESPEATHSTRVPIVADPCPSTWPCFVSLTCKNPQNPRHTSETVRQSSTTVADIRSIVDRTAAGIACSRILLKKTSQYLQSAF